jgi:hypothetical protein
VVVYLAVEAGEVMGEEVSEADLKSMIDNVWVLLSIIDNCCDDLYEVVRETVEEIREENRGYEISYRLVAEVRADDPMS